MKQRYVVYEIFTRSRVVEAATAEEACGVPATAEDWPQVAFSGRHCVPVDVQPESSDSIWQAGKSPAELPVRRA